MHFHIVYLVLYIFGRSAKLVKLIAVLIYHEHSHGSLYTIHQISRQLVSYSNFTNLVFRKCRLSVAQDFSTQNKLKLILEMCFTFIQFERMAVQEKPNVILILNRFWNIYHYCSNNINMKSSETTITILLLNGCIIKSELKMLITWIALYFSSSIMNPL